MTPFFTSPFSFPQNSTLGKEMRCTFGVHFRMLRIFLFFFLLLLFSENVLVCNYVRHYFTMGIGRNCIARGLRNSFWSVWLAQWRSAATRSAAPSIYCWVSPERETARSQQSYICKCLLINVWCLFFSNNMLHSTPSTSTSWSSRTERERKQILNSIPNTFRPWIQVIFPVQYTAFSHNALFFIKCHILLCWKSQNNSQVFRGDV